MKKFIKQGQIFNSPVVITINGRVIYSNSQNYLKKFGYELYIPQKPVKTKQQLIEQSVNKINAQTDEKILNNFTYNNEQFYLTQENQINFANLFTAKEFIEYPQTIKTKNGYMELDGISAVIAFYLSGITFVKECLEEGWIKKQKAKEEILTNQ